MRCLESGIKEKCSVNGNVGSVYFVIPGDPVYILYYVRTGSAETDKNDHVRKTGVASLIIFDRKSSERAVPDETGTGKYAADRDSTRRKLVEDLISAIPRSIEYDGLIRFRKI